MCGEEVAKKAAQDAADGDLIISSFDPDDPMVRRARSVPGVYVDEDDDDDEEEEEDKQRDGLSSASGGDVGRWRQPYPRH